MSIRFEQLDPRNTQEAIEHNNKILKYSVLGIEITITKLAERCSLGNINHLGDWAAIDNAYKSPDWDHALKCQDFTIAILKPDCDSIGAAAVIQSHWNAMRKPREDGVHVFNGKEEIEEELNRLKLPKWEKVELISKLDRFAKDPTWKPSSLPTKENPWPSCGGVETSLETAALQTMCADNSLPLSTRIDYMMSWLAGLDCDYFLEGLEGGKSYISQIEKERQDLITALETGQIKHIMYGPKEPNKNGCWDTTPDFVLVETTHRAATMVGYCEAPVVIAINPEFRFQDLLPVRKITICAWSDQYADIPDICKDMNELEPGWGGHGNICGSPQRISTKLDTKIIIEIVEKHLCTKLNVQRDRDKCNCGSGQPVSTCNSNSTYCG